MRHTHVPQKLSKVGRFPSGEYHIVVLGHQGCNGAIS
jgi:hypothetical protein